MIKNFSNFISKKIDTDTNIIWFEKSNKYIIINNFLNSLILNKIDSNKYPLNQFFSETNGLGPDNLKTIFNDIIMGLGTQCCKQLSTGCARRRTYTAG